MENKCLKCKCGFPLPPKLRTIKDTIFGAKEITETCKYKCPECGRENIY